MKITTIDPINSGDNITTHISFFLYFCAQYAMIAIATKVKKSKRITQKSIVVSG